MSISQRFSKHIIIFVQLVLIALISISTLTAQTGGVDPTFNPVISKDTTGGQFTLQPDGKILTYGTFQVINGAVRTNIARLNADGTLDSSFNCTACNFSVSSAVVQPDGKIIVAGSLSAADNAASAARLRRLNADGSLDNSFNPTSPFNDNPVFPSYYGADVYAVQTDGKILVVLGGSTSGFSFGSLQRLNADGSNDTTFNPIQVISGRLIRTAPTKIFLQSDGEILIALTTTSASGSGSTLTRYNANGTPDSTFEQPIFAGTGNFGEYSNIGDFAVLADGSIIVVGSFKKVNAIDRNFIVKLRSAGNIDLSFAPTNVVMVGGRIKIYSNGKILISTGNIPNPIGPSGTTNQFIRYNADGSVDNTFTSPADLLFANNFVIDSSDRVLLYGSFTENGGYVNKFARLNTDGSVNSSFIVNYGNGGSVTTAAIQADGKVLIAGDFTQVGSITRNKIARLNSDGSVDQTFSPGTGFNTTIEKIFVQPDGKILVGGSFTNYNGMTKIALARLNTDGSLDASFNTILENNAVIYSIDLQSDGKIIIGGFFTIYANGQLIRNALARLNADGSLDSSFNPSLGNPSGFTNASVRRVVVQPDGKIIVGGYFNGVNGFSRSSLVRLNGDGTLDAAFNAGNISDVSGVSGVELYPNGKYVVSTGNVVMRRNNDGTTDASFQTSTLSGVVSAISVQSDGSIIIGGSFTSGRLTRLKADGTTDTTFFPNGANNTVRVIVRQNDGSVIVGGDFTTIANLNRLGIARLMIAPVRAPFTPFDFDGDGRADVAVFRPSNGFWYQLRSQNNAFSASQFGQSSDRLAPADYDGDGRADLAVFRDNVPGAGGLGYFYITDSSTNTFRPVQFGVTGDIPVTGDWDGDGIADLAVYRSALTAGGQSYFIYRASSVVNAGFTVISWGTLGDKPLVGDFDGDGKLDAAVFRPSNAIWYILQSSNRQVIQQPFGVATDIPVPADYDGDGKTNIAVFRPSTGYWYTSTNPQTNYGGVQFGAAGDLPAAADYDGDGKADITVFRPSNGSWYLLRSTAGFTGVQFGASEDRPIPSAFIR